MTLADLVSELGAQMPLTAKRDDSLALLRQAGVGVRREAGGGVRVAANAQGKRLAGRRLPER